MTGWPIANPTTELLCGCMVHGNQVPLCAMDITRGPHGAWQAVKDISGALKFLGGKSFAPKDTTDIKCYTISRAPVGADSMMPRFTVAHLEMDRGIVVGAHQTPAISNALQRQVQAIVEAAFPKDDRLSPTTYGVSYHASLPRGARHVWMVHALNEEVQELVAQALEGRKLSMVEASVYKAAEELQRLQKGVIIFKAMMRRVLESESSGKTRREAARLLFTKKRDGVYQKADEELLAARGLKYWETSDDELREAYKQARTEAKTAFLRAAVDTLAVLMTFVEGIDDVEHAKWTLEQKRTA